MWEIQVTNYPGRSNAKDRRRHGEPSDMKARRAVVTRLTLWRALTLFGPRMLERERRKSRVRGGRVETSAGTGARSLWRPRPALGGARQCVTLNPFMESKWRNGAGIFRNFLVASINCDRNVSKSAGIRWLERVSSHRHTRRRAGSVHSVSMGRILFLMERF